MLQNLTNNKNLSEIWIVEILARNWAMYYKNHLFNNQSEIKFFVPLKNLRKWPLFSTVALLCMYKAETNGSVKRSWFDIATCDFQADFQQIFSKDFIAY